MGIKAVLVGVSDYSVLGYRSLPLCKNDLSEMKNALISGLNVIPSDIYLCGENDAVKVSDFIDILKIAIMQASEKDTFIFYFSGHGGNGKLALSDGEVSLNNLLDIIDTMNFKNKIAILDSCYSGDFHLNNTLKLSSIDNIDIFVGRGFAVMASCRDNQKSGFDNQRQMSLYTRFVCDALMYDGIIRKGKKSLESINELIYRFAKIENCTQQPVFRSNIGGTIYFEVKQYTPYKSAQFYKETEKYVICNVKPLHHGGTKRLAAMVMVKNRPSVSEIALYSNEIKEDILYADIYNNEIEEKRYNGKPTNIIFIYFGCDEADMSNSNYMYITTWIDENQDANHWYNMSDGSVVENGVHIKTNTGYDLIRKLNNEKVDNDEFMQKVKLITFEIISLSEQIINRYREFINGTISEVQLINELCTINKAMNTAYIKYSDLPVAPVELRDWAQMHDQLIGSAVDLSLFYSNEGAQKWSAENRRWLMEDSIKKYEEALEALKNVEK